MLTLLPIIALAFFIAHVLLIFTSFGKKGYRPRKYLWSHITLWIAGILLSLFLSIYAGEPSVMNGAFDTPLKKAFPVLLAFGLSILAHLVVKLLILPRSNSVRVNK